MRIPGISITRPDFWQDRNECTDDMIRYIFRSSTPESFPLLEDRIACLRQVGEILYEVSLP